MELKNEEESEGKVVKIGGIVETNRKIFTKRLVQKWLSSQ
jgi:hypothetical protein